MKRVLSLYIITNSFILLPFNSIDYKSAVKFYILLKIGNTVKHKYFNYAACSLFTGY